MSDWAFPCPGFTRVEKSLGEEFTVNIPHSNGLTKREFFAAAAMQGLVTAITKFVTERSDIIVHRPEDIAEISLNYADALIAELEKK